MEQMVRVINDLGNTLIEVVDEHGDVVIIVEEEEE